MEIPKEKRKILSGYRLLNTKIDRLEEMGNMFPNERKNYESEAKKCRGLMKKIEVAIKAIDDGVLSEILFQKYVLGRSLETISYSLCYSKRQTERLHISALNKLEI